MRRDIVPNMFDQAFHRRIETILARLSASDHVSTELLGSCLGAITVCLHEAEVRDACVREFLDLVFDRVQRGPAMAGDQLATELRGLLEDTPGLSQMTRGYAQWSSAPIQRAAIGREEGERRWDVKELDNRLIGLNLASLSRLRNQVGLRSERPIGPGADLRRRRRFKACLTMQMSDRHDAGINGEQVDRLIRYLGRGDSDSDPRGGRHAILG